MGVDVSLFTKKAKVRLCADRAWVLSAYYSDDPLAEELSGYFRDSSRGLDKEHALLFFDLLKKGHENNEDNDEDRKDYALYWLNEMCKFVEKYPEDTFFALNDHEDEYHDIYDEYVRFDPLLEKLK